MINKPEVYFFGQITGASDLSEGGDGIFIEAYFNCGKDWSFISGTKILYTQSGYVDDDEFVCFSHPFDLHYTTESYSGWPKIIVKIYKLDETDTIDLMGYGTYFLPNKSGYHEIEFYSWTLHGDKATEIESYFLDSKPMLRNMDPVEKNLDLREWLTTKPGPKIHLNVEVLLKNFKGNERRLAK